MTNKSYQNLFIYSTPYKISLMLHTHTSNSNVNNVNNENKKGGKL